MVVSVLLAIDPASHGCGCALFRDGRLVAAEYVRGAKSGSGPRECAQAAYAVSTWLDVLYRRDTFGLRANDFEPAILVMEFPQVYSRGANKTKGDPNTCVLPLVAVDAALATVFSKAEVHVYQPHAWKQGTSKPEHKDIGKVEYVIIPRVKVRLLPEELAVTSWPGPEDSKADHERSFDVADAIGVGLHHLGRFERHRVYARE